MFLLNILLIVGLVSAGGCKQEDVSAKPSTEVPAVEVTRLVSAKFIGEYTPAQIKSRIGNRAEIGLFTKYSVKVYSLVYTTTDTKGQPVQASGALLVPVANQAFPLLSLQHGTITDDKNAPSYYGSNSEVWTFGTVMASSGYILAAPDYLGYGVSRQLAHPYEHASSLANASADLLLAAKEFFRQNSVQWNKQLFLAGYSEGGYATMALHKHLQENYAEELPVTASAPGAGAYNKTAFAKDILQNNRPLEYINSYLWVLQTYNTVYELNRPFSYYLNQPYAGQVQKFGVQAQVSKYPQQLFTDTFKKAVLTGSDTDLLKTFVDNNIFDWKPEAPVYLIHGTADDFVPFYNSQTAYDAMIANGAIQVTLRKIEGGNHFSSVAAYTLETFMFFSSFGQQ
ncbi:alpha/beta fold hydrolase [Rhodocytophaga rosea]|uniref:Alpha/beta fold hydrolase n=1 Tax=Rhodocytophaga rosea TaxID=2704465 RepID=A0A6C0GDY3_9BACT|nr:lipase family protein [Rhodocytophaga rosea]QHT66148.1 alpha/beta fold hydrolase [Rhodocytophaga rosea]